LRSSIWAARSRSIDSDAVASPVHSGEHAVQRLQRAGHLEVGELAAIRSLRDGGLTARLSRSE